MKKTCILCIILLLLLCACVPTPETEYVTNKGDDIAGERIRTESLPINEAEKTLAASIPTFAAHWTDRIQTKDADMLIDAEVITKKQDKYPVYSIRRADFFEMELQRFVDFFFPTMQGYRKGTSPGKEDYEQAIDHAMLKSEEHVQYLFDQYRATDITDEDFVKSNQLYVDLHGEKTSHTVLHSDGTKGSIFLSTSVLEISKYAWSVVHSKNDVERNGSYEGEANATVQASIPYEQAVHEANALFEELQLNGFELCNSEQARLFDMLGLHIWSTGWHLQFCRPYGYIPYNVREHDSSHNGFFSFESDRDYARGWQFEWVDVYVSDQGIQYLNWVNPIEIIGLANENVELLSFDDITTVINRTLHAAMHYPEHMFGWFKLEKLILTSAPQPMKDSRDGYLMPIWICEIRCYLTEDAGKEDVETVLLTVGFNALDGTRVDLS